MRRHLYGENHHSVASGLEDLAEIYKSQRTQRRYEEAASLYEEALQIWEFLDNGVRQVNILHSLMAIHLRLGQGRQMLQYGEQALEISRGLPRSVGPEAESLLFMGHAYSRLENERKALEYYQQAAVLFEAENRLELVAIAQNEVGQSYSSLGEHENAVIAHNRVLEYYRSQEDVPGQISTLESLASAELRLYRLGRAVDLRLQILELQQQVDDVQGQFETYSHLGTIYLGYVSPDKSLEYKRKAIALYEEAEKGGQPLEHRFQYLRVLGSAHFTEGRFREAFTVLEESIQFARETQPPDVVAPYLTVVASQYTLLGKNHEALELLIQAQKIGDSLEQPLLASGVLRELARVYFTLGELQRALDLYAQALELQQSVEARQQKAETLLGLSRTYRDLGEYDLALETCELALNLLREMNNSFLEAQAYQERGHIHLKQDRYEEALEEFEKAHRLLGEVHLSLGALEATRIMIGRASAYTSLQQYPQALEAAASALSIARNIPFLESSALRIRGKIHIAMGEPRKALDDFSLALDRARTPNFPLAALAETVALENIGEAHQELEEFPQAVEAFARALELDRESGDRVREARSLHHLAQVERQRDRLDEAQGYAEATLAVVESLRGNLVSPELRTSYVATAYEYHEFYIDLLMQRHWQSPDSALDALAFQASERARARGLLELLAEAKAEIRQGVEPQLLQEERTLQQRIQQAEKHRAELHSKPSPPALRQQAKQQVRQLLSQYQELQDRIRAASPEYAALQYPEPLTLTEVQQQVLDEETMLLQYSLGEERSYLWVVTQEELHSYELPSRATIENAAKALYAKVTGQTVPEARNRGLDTVERSCNEPATSANAPASACNPAWQGSARQLVELLLAPMAAQLEQNGDIKRLVFVGDGVLQYVPFGALPSPESPETSPELLLDRYEVVGLPSSSTLATLRQFDDPSPAPESLAIFADPVFGKTDVRVQRSASRDSEVAQPTAPPAQAAPIVVASSQDLASHQSQAIFAQATQNARSARGEWEDEEVWARLPGTRQEAEAIAQLVDTDALLQKYDFEVTHQTVTDPGALSQYRFVHFATHGNLDSADPQLSGLVLSLVDEAGTPKNGYLRLHDIFNLELGADLVVLSACQTGLGETIRGEGVVGLTRGFMYAGSPRVVVSLWNVDDHSTAFLMSEFYQNMLERQMSPAAALRAAQQTVRENPQWASPFYWAGFTLQGEWRW